MRTLIGIASLTVLIGMAAPASADPTGEGSGSDGSFLASLKQQGVTYKNGPVAISVGKKSCELMDQGHSKSEVISSLSSDNPGFSTDNATKFTTNAIKAYCPQHAEDANPAPSAAAPAASPQPQQPAVNLPAAPPPAP